MREKRFTENDDQTMADKDVLESKTTPKLGAVGTGDVDV